jgi:hypothetical protein
LAFLKSTQFEERVVADDDNREDETGKERWEWEEWMAWLNGEWKRGETRDVIFSQLVCGGGLWVMSSISFFHENKFWRKTHKLTPSTTTAKQQKKVKSTSLIASFFKALWN